MTFKLTAIQGNSQKLDGGAMFGNVPKALWQQWVEVDNDNRIELGCRALLLQSEQKTILLETGIGAFFEPKLKVRFGVVEEQHILLNSLAELGVKPGDIDAIILSHLHFDHAGGMLTAWQPGAVARLVFENARYYVGSVAWQRAQHPHYRDRASFVPHLNALLQDSGRLHLIEAESDPWLGPAFSFFETNGHSPGMLHTEITYRGVPLVFAADLIPGIPWIHLPVTMGYDRSPERLIDEKSRLLERLCASSGRLFFTHDPQTAFAEVGRDARGRFIACNGKADFND